MSSNKKTFYYKVFSNPAIPLWDMGLWDTAYWDIAQPTTPITTWSTDVISEPTFRSVVNSGPGELKVRLARKLDSFGEGLDVKLNNKVELWVSDRETNATRLYTGFISSYTEVMDGNKEYVDISLLGYNAETSYHFLKDSNGNTALQYFSEDPSNIMTDALQKYQNEGGNLTYTPSSIQLTGTVVTYTFNLNTIKEVLDKVVELTPQGWYWYVDANGVVNLKNYNLAVPDYKFTVGKDIDTLSVTKRNEDIVNRAYIIGGTPAYAGQLFRRYDRTTSQGTNYVHEAKVTDGRVYDPVTADIMAKRLLDDKQNPEFRIQLRVSDSNGEDSTQGFDIEQITVGKSLQIQNAATSGFTGQTFVVASVIYTPDYVEIEATNRLPEVSKRIEDVQRNLDNQIQSEIPVIATIGVV